MNNVTLFRAFQNDKDQGRVNPPAGKVWRKNLKTKAVTKTSAPKCSTFDITRASVQNLDELRQLLLSLDKSHAVTWSTPDDPDAVTVVPDQRAKSDEGEVGRTNVNFSWPAGLGVLMLDIDPPKYAAVSPLPLPLEDWTPENVIDAIEAAVPELTGLSWLYRPSSSSFLYDVQEDKWVTELKGFRLYAMVDDARKIPDIGKMIFKRLFIDGRGFVASSSGGSLLVRGLIDASVWQTSRFDFAGPPSCSKALEWRGNAETVVSEGDMAMIITADLPTWSDDEEIAFLAKRDETASAEPFATDMRKIGIEHHSETERESAKERGEKLTEDQIVERAAKRYAEAGAGKLYGVQPIEVLDYSRKVSKALDLPRDNDGTVMVTVQDILDHPEVFDGALTRDPLDPDYHDGAQVGKLYTSGDMLILSSQAHGGVKYSLERVSAEDVMNEFRDVMPTTEAAVAPKAPPKAPSKAQQKKKKKEEQGPSKEELQKIRAKGEVTMASLGIERMDCHEMFELSEDGNKITVLRENSKGKLVSHDLCTAFELVAKIVDYKTGSGYGRRIRFTDENGRTRIVNVNFEEHLGSLQAIKKFCHNIGLNLNPYLPASIFEDLITNIQTSQLVRVSTNCGWLKEGDEYVFIHPARPDPLTKDGRDSSIEYDPKDENIPIWPEPQGTLEGWQDAIRHFAQVKDIETKHHITLCIASAFAGPLVRFWNPSFSRAINIAGDSSMGKSTGMQIGTSVWSAPLQVGYGTYRQARGSINAIELLRHQTSDIVLFLDDIASYSGDISDLAMSFGDNAGKTRMGMNFKSTKTSEYTSMVITAFEKSLDIASQERGAKKMLPGGRNRWNDYDMFTCKAFEDQSDYLTITEQLQDHHGIAGIRYIEYLLDEGFMDDEAAKLKSYFSGILEDVEDAVTQIAPGHKMESRHLVTLVLILAGSDIAKDAGILPEELNVTSLIGYMIRLYFGEVLSQDDEDGEICGEGDEPVTVSAKTWSSPIGQKMLGVLRRLVSGEGVWHLDPDDDKPGQKVAYNYTCKGQSCIVIPHDDDGFSAFVRWSGIGTSHSKDRIKYWLKSESGIVMLHPKGRQKSYVGKARGNMIGNGFLFIPINCLTEGNEVE